MIPPVSLFFRRTMSKPRASGDDPEPGILPETSDR